MCGLNWNDIEYKFHDVRKEHSNWMAFDEEEWINVDEDRVVPAHLPAMIMDWYYNGKAQLEFLRILYNDSEGFEHDGRDAHIFYKRMYDDVFITELSYPKGSKNRRYYLLFTMIKMYLDLKYTTEAPQWVRSLGFSFCVGMKEYAEVWVDAEIDYVKKMSGRDDFPQELAERIVNMIDGPFEL